MDAQNSAASSGCSKDLSKKWIGCLSLDTPAKCNVESGSSKRCCVGNSDRLSALPRDIQRKILSLIPTTDAAKTGFTSRMWRSTWNSITKLIFKYDQFPGPYRSIAGKRGTFVRFINHALACHDASDVHVFELWLWPSIDHSISIYVRWIRFAIKHNVKKLILFGKMARNTKIPQSVFSCSSILKLELAIEGYVLTWPETCTLPNLKKLKMKFLVFHQGLRRDFFTSCPALEKLSICFCDVTNFKYLPATAPKLTEFVMCHCLGMGNCSLSFETASLSKFIYISGEASEIMLFPTQLFGLIISEQRVCVKHKSTSHLTSSVIKVTRELFKANFVVFNSWLAQSLSMANDLQRQLAVDVFCNVGRLDIDLLSNMTNVRTILLLISRCTFVSTVTLDLESSSRETEEYPELDLDLRNLNSRRSFGELTDIRIGNFGGSDVELTLVKILLANAHALYLMRIGRNMTMVRSNTMLEKIETILAYEKASSSADVIFD